MMSFIEEFAAQLGTWLEPVVPGIEGRTFAVSEVDPFTKDNMPTLPIGYVAVVSQTAPSFPNLQTTFVVEIVLEPVRAIAGDCETPFWAYYDVDAVRDAIWGNLWRLEDKWGNIIPSQVDIEADRLAVYVSLTFTRQSIWKDSETCAEPDPCKPITRVPTVRFRVETGPVDLCACPPKPHPEECSCETCWVDKEEDR